MEYNNNVDVGVLLSRVTEMPPVLVAASGNVERYVLWIGDNVSEYHNWKWEGTGSGT